MHLDGPQSDKDYKILVAPDFLDLYRGKDKFSLPVGYDAEHNSAIDFRKFDSLLRKGNMNTIEYLFSKEINLYDNSFTPYFELATKAYQEGYLTHVWDYFFASAKGMAINTIKRCNDSIESRKKATARAMWIINFISYIIRNNYRISSYVWDCYNIYKEPREVRYGNNNFVIYTEEKVREEFDHLAEMAEMEMENTTNYSFLLQDYKNQIACCAENIIADAIRHELEVKW